MPSFADSIFLFVLALLLFGPKKLPVLARELGKWMGEFRRASNEFKMQMEDELRASEQADRQKQIAALEAAAPVPPPLGEPAEPEHPHMRSRTPAAAEDAPILEQADTPVDTVPDAPEPSPYVTEESRPVPIATAGSLHMMPPATGLPTARSRNVGPSGEGDALSGFVEAIPEVATHATPASVLPEHTPATQEEVALGD